MGVRRESKHEVIEAMTPTTITAFKNSRFA
jgi:hypothetical protein